MGVIMKNLNSKKIQDVVVFRPNGAKMTVEVQLKNETVWLSQKQMAELFNKDVNTISEHISNLF